MYADTLASGGNRKMLNKYKHRFSGRLEAEVGEMLARHTRGLRPARTWSFLLVLALLTSVGVRAQVEDAPTISEQEKDKSIQQPNEPNRPHSLDPANHAFVKTFLKDEMHIWTNPFRANSYSSRAFPKYVIPFTLITGVLIATDHRTSELLPNTQ